VRDTIARGVGSGVLAYVGKTGAGDYEPFVYNKSLSANDVELSGDVYIVTKETAPTGTVSKLTWGGTIPHQKWMLFFTKVLSKFSGSKGLKLTVTVEAVPEGGISSQKVEETKVALRELGMDDDVTTG
jgi:hypothetical protein